MVGVTTDLWVCGACGAEVPIRWVDEGRSFLFIACPQCKDGWLTLSDEDVDRIAVAEWFRPSPRQLRIEYPADEHHVLTGGVVVRMIDP